MMTPQVLDRLVCRPGDAPQEPPLTASRVIGICVARAAQDMLGLAVSVDTVSEEDGDLAAVTDRLADDLLILSIERAEKQVGLVACNADLVAASLEALTTGRIAPSPQASRRITNTDAALIRPWFTQILQEMAQACAGSDLDGWSAECGVHARFDSLRAVEFALPEARFRIMRIAMSDQVTPRTPELILALPRQDVSQEAPPAALGSDWAGRLSHVVMAAPLALDAVLGRVTLNLAQLTALEEGDCVPLGIRGLDGISLTASDGSVVARGRLGQLDGQIAVRINTDVAEPAADLAAYPRPAAASMTRIEEALSGQSMDEELARPA